MKTAVKRDSLLFRISLIIGGMLFFFFAAAGVYLYMTNQGMETLEKTKIEDSFKSQLANLSDAAYFEFRRPLKEMVSQLMRANASVDEVEIVARGRRLLYEVSPHSQPNASNFYATFPLLQDGKRFGALHIRYHTYYAERTFRQFLVNLGFLTLVMGFFLVWGFLYIRRSIRQLSEFAEKVAAIDPASPQLIRQTFGYAELQMIVDAINRLLRSVHAYAKDLQATNRLLRENETKLMRAQRIAKMSSWSYYPERKKLEVSQEFYRLMEIDRHDFRGSLFRFALRAIHPEDRATFMRVFSEALAAGGRFELVHRVVTNRGKTKYVRTEGKVRRSRYRETEVIGISMDITDEMEAKRQLDYMAMYDPLTGLLNRRALMEQLDYLMRLSRRNGSTIALIFIDLDNFKLINDTYGHGVGDELLQRTAHTLKSMVRESDLTARIGGDEFVLAFSEIDDRETVAQLCEKVLEHVAVQQTIDAHTFMVTCSVGAALFPIDAEEVDDLLRYADAAMYEAKKEGKNRYRLFDDAILSVIQERKSLYDELRTALEKEDEIRLYFQPQVELKSGCVIGAEVLTRWHHPQRGVLFPNRYLPLIEGHELMRVYDEYVLHMAFKQLHKWNEVYGKRWKLGVNLSASQFNDQTLVQRLEKLLVRYDRVDPSQIDLEITESLPMQDVSAGIAMLNRLRTMGFTISIDDFGTGYSSLSYLRRLPFDVIKIDREFVKDIHEDTESLEIVRMTVQIARSLGRKTVAEGPDRPEHIPLLIEAGCDYAQGFYYSKAIEEDDFVEYATKREGALEG